MKNLSYSNCDNLIFTWRFQWQIGIKIVLKTIVAGERSRNDPSSFSRSAVRIEWLGD